MKTHKTLSLAIIVFGFLLAAERQDPKQARSRDECGYSFIVSCYDDTTCYPASWLSDGQCDPALSCYEDDGMDCDGGDGGLFMEDCAVCESADNAMTCYDLLGQWINCFGCYSVYDCEQECLGSAALDCAGECDGNAVFDECGECNGNGIGDGACDCAGNVPEGTCDCDGNPTEDYCDCNGSTIDVCGICGGDGNWCSAPAAESGSYALDEDNIITVYLSASDADGDALTFNIASTPLNGTLEFDGIAATYIPNANFNGEDSFTFFASDGGQNSNVATIDLIINPVNDAPYFYSIPDAEVTLGDFFVYPLEAMDVDGDVLVYTVTNISGDGSATLAENVLTVQAEATGVIDITIMVSDGMITDQESFILTVLAPVCAEEYEQGFFDGAATGDINGDGVLNIVDIVLSIEMILNEEE